MHPVLNIALGGAIGAVMRFLVATGVHRAFGQGFPYGTLTVNTVGSLAMGFLYVWLIERTGLPPAWRALLMTGFLGGFTTFSAFSIESLQLIQTGELGKAALNILLNVLLCLLAAWAGVMIGRQI